MAAQPTAARLVPVTFSACGHTAMVPQASAPASCPNGCDPLRREDRRVVVRPRTR